MSAMFLRSFTLPSGEREFEALWRTPLDRMTIYGSRWPFGLFPERELETVAFAPITILAGGNGSGKSTLLRVIAARLSLLPEGERPGSPFFDAYVPLCTPGWEAAREAPPGSRMLSGEDVFAALAARRRENHAVAARREALLEAYRRDQPSPSPDAVGFRLGSLSDADRLHAYNDAQRHTPSRYVRERLGATETGCSNGEEALSFLRDALRDDALYLLDEPENCLSPAFQTALAAHLADCARFFGCQLVIATHSPILLALPGARVYDLDARPARVCPWTELEGVRTLAGFFAEHAGEFD